MSKRTAAHMQFRPLWELGHRLHASGHPLGYRAARIIDSWIRFRWGCDLPVTLTLPEDVTFMHNALGVVIHPKVVFEGPAIVYHRVTIGMAHRKGAGIPRIGSHVLIGAGACIVGTVTVGDACVIGANAVVTRDVPPGSIVSAYDREPRPLDRATVMGYFAPAGAETPAH